ncbi:hypothetical protein NQ641_18840 [Acinetobacter baumannii]|uniref:hypothetical protein n=1 Tax=Acinetobacter sp. YH12153 TaxID=2601133 RepID=UPI0015D25037|nr:hypothetical protein [Acinetobacter sp. YH12153]MDC4347172.1 hypothetical protein [Acinetobacter baumannii]
MKLKLFMSCAIVGLFSTVAHADYASEKARYDSIKNQFGSCISTTLKQNGDDSKNTILNCYDSAQDALTSQIKSIRTSKKQAINEAEWKEINLNHQKGVQACTEISNSVPYSNFTGYLDIECEANFYFSLAEAAIEMHYPKPKK